MAPTIALATAIAHATTSAAAATSAAAVGTAELPFTMLAFLTPGPAQVLIVGLVILLLFGNRLPSVMRSLGEGITEFKKGIKGGETDPNANLEDHRDEDVP